MSILAAILVFCLLILSHELGHFSMAKLVGIYVYDFSLGMGPKLLAFKGKETQYTLRLFPIGGHCLMMGEDENSDDPRAFNKKKVWQRILVILGGPAMNFLAAVLIFVVLFMMLGATSGASEVGSLVEGQAAEAAGLLPGDIIIEINEQPIQAWAEIGPAVTLHEAGEPIQVVVQRKSENIALTIQPYYEEESGRWLIGILPAVVRQNFFTAIGLGFKQSYIFTRDLLVALGGIISGKEKPDVAGPVGVVSIISEATSYGFQSLLFITAILCVNLAVINLLPIPALDGSRIVFLLVEGLRGKPIKPEREGIVHFIGLMLLFALMIIITFKDIVRLISGG
ncbi:MAG: site-2 protease family protein [Firmicutes bacterium]|nr:site-2 protease family protein [Bacillota bacterium]